MVPRFCVAIKQNAFKLKRAREIFTINITDGRVVKMSSQMGAALSVFYFAEPQMVQKSLASSLFCCKQVEECGHLRVGRKNGGKTRLVVDKWKSPD